MKFRCPFCRNTFEKTEGHACPHCGRTVLMPGFFKKLPRPAEGGEAAGKPGWNPPARRAVKPLTPLALLGNSGFKVGAILLVMMIVGVALVNKTKAPPANQDARKIERARLSLANLRVALDLYREDCGAYPAGAEGLAALVHAPDSTTNWQGPYIFELKNDLWGAPFHYDNSETNLALFGCGPDQTPGTADDLVVEKAEIDFRREAGTVHAVIVFRDGARKIIHHEVNVEPAIRAGLLNEGNR